MSPTRPTMPSQSPATASGKSVADDRVESSTTAAELSLTDFLDVATLQDMQDSFASITRLHTSIRDGAGRPITAPTDAVLRDQSDRMLQHLIMADEDKSDRFIAPIVVEGQQLGSIIIEPQTHSPAGHIDRDRFRALAGRLGVESEAVEQLLDHTEETSGPNRAAAVQFLYLLANHIARLCYGQYHARKRVEELSVLYRISTLLSAHRDLQQVLDTAVRSVAQVMKVKSVSIRLIEENGTSQLVPRAVHNLSQSYLEKGFIEPESEMFHAALEGEMVYIEDLTQDRRVRHPQHAAREGLVSMLCTGMIFQDKPIGVVQLFSDRKRWFSESESRLVRAIAQLLATAIRNARLEVQRTEDEQMIRQLHLAADVQRRMLPGAMPHVPPFDIAARYVPSLELGGDFYDFIHLDGQLGIVIGDVVGKGVAASLLMASVRASLRAYAQDVLDLDEVVTRVNTALSQDTLDNEFATVWYGVLDPVDRRLTYCNAGHDPPLLVRDDRIHALDVGGMVVGIDPSQPYQKGVAELHSGDLLLLYTDGLADAFNFEQQRFGRRRIEQAVLEAAQRGGSAHDSLNHILWEMRRFTGLRPSIDDTTLVVVKVDKGQP